MSVKVTIATQDRAEQLPYLEKLGHEAKSNSIVRH